MQIIIIRNYVLKSGSGLKKTQTEPDLSTNGRDLPEARITFAKYLLAGEQNCIFFKNLATGSLLRRQNTGII